MKQKVLLSFSILHFSFYANITWVKGRKCVLCFKDPILGNHFIDRVHTQLKDMEVRSLKNYHSKVQLGLAFRMEMEEKTCQDLLETLLAWHTSHS